MSAKKSKDNQKPIYKVQGGCTLWARKTIDSKIFSKPDKWFKIWFYIVNRVHYTANSTLRRGQCHLKYDNIMLSCGATKGEVDHCIRWLKNCRMLATQKATRGFVVTVCNYDRYQNIDNYKSDRNGDLKATQKRQDNEEGKKEHKKDTKDSGKLPKPQRRDSPNRDNDKFEQFWVVYPKKVGKKEARKAFEKINPSDELFGKMRVAIEQQKKSEQWRKEGGRYIPNPATWLNGARWEDEIPTKPELKRGDPDWLPTEEEAEELLKEVEYDN